MFNHKKKTIEYQEKVIEALHNRYYDLAAERDALLNVSETLQANYESLLGSHDSLEEAYRAAVDGYNELLAEHNHLKDLYDQSLKDYDELLDGSEVRRLRSDIKVLESNLDTLCNSNAKNLNHALRLKAENESLKQALADEKYRHDRLQDFEVAEAQQLEHSRNTGAFLEQQWLNAATQLGRAKGLIDEIERQCEFAHAHKLDCGYAWALNMIEEWRKG